MRTRPRRGGDPDHNEHVIEINDSPNVDILQRLPRTRRQTVRYIESLNDDQQEDAPSSPDDEDTPESYLRRRGARRTSRTSRTLDEEDDDDDEEDEFVEQPSFEAEEEEEEEGDANEAMDDADEAERPSPDVRPSRTAAKSVLDESPGTYNTRRAATTAAESSRDQLRYVTRRQLRESIEPEEDTSSFPESTEPTAKRYSTRTRRSGVSSSPADDAKKPRYDDIDALRSSRRRLRHNSDDVVAVASPPGDSNSRYTLRDRSTIARNVRLGSFDESQAASSKKKPSATSSSYDTRSSSTQVMDRATRYALRARRHEPDSPKRTNDDDRKSYSLRNRSTLQRRVSDAPPVPSSLYDDYGDARPPKRSKQARKYLDLSGSGSSSDGEMQMVKRSSKNAHKKASKPPPPADISPLDIDPSITWDSIGGLKSHIHALQEMVLLPLLYPEFYAKFSMAPPSGVLFYGPPGTGKTLVARALANSSGNQKITFYMRKGADCLSKWVGEAERQLRVLFEQAKKTEPSIIFFDEIDGLAPVRSAKQDQIHASIVSTLLALMDGLDSRGRVIVIGATNRIDSIDPALRRPGRFDRELAFTLPNATDRASMLGIHTKHWQPPLAASFKTQLANDLVGYCGADIKALCAETALVAFKRTFPQVYDTPAKLEIDLHAIQILRADFQVAQAKIVPAAARAQTAVATPLPPLLQPLLETALTTLVQVVQASFPGGLFSPPPLLPSNSAPIYDFPTTACPSCLDPLDQNPVSCPQCHHPFHATCLTPDRRCSSCLPSFTYLPPTLVRCLVHGSSGSLGQSVLTSALLSQLDGFPCIQFDRFATPTEWRAKWAEVLTHVPCIVFCPHLDQAWADHPSELPSLLHHWMQSAHHLPIVVIATASTTADDLPDAFVSLFPASHRLELQPPTRSARKAFWQVLRSWVASPPPVPLPPPKPLRVVAPPAATSTAPTKPSLNDQEQHQLRELRIFLEAVVSYCIRQKTNAPFVLSQDGCAIDLNTIRDRVHDGEYTTWEAFMRDIHAIVQDAYATYPKHSPLRYIAHAAANMQDNVMSFAHRFRKEQGYDLFAKCREIQDAKLAARPVPKRLTLKRPGQMPPPSVVTPPVVEAEPEEIVVLEVFKEGDHVFVEKRTGPGMNKLGGAGRVQQVYMDDSDATLVSKYDVKYILGGFEKEVPVKFVRRLTEDTVQNSVKMYATTTVVGNSTAALAAATPTPEESFDMAVWPHLYQAGWEFVVAHALWVADAPENVDALDKDELMETHMCFETRDAIVAHVKATPALARLCFGTRFVEMNIADGLLPKPTLWTPQEEMYYMALEDKPIATTDVSSAAPETDHPRAFVLDEAKVQEVIRMVVQATDGWTFDELRQELVKFNHIVLAHRDAYDRATMIKALKARITELLQ
ncbi:Aste57867_2912 [Aphanomyces stellatus]|uniref:Aste57867_2912 protein n=1 Tax=Aphanomyces stellatus TaxID=120398 RepID=A0A485KCC2_9STRA|nr:hypothetical protein As57867_002904 [Aphanomyces stellatus]VFT80095.1 Aste57867_2912 [Aphanomyces stellatus]